MGHGEFWANFQNIAFFWGHLGHYLIRLGHFQFFVYLEHLRDLGLFGHFWVLLGHFPIFEDLGILLFIGDKFDPIKDLKKSQNLQNTPDNILFDFWASFAATS